jgi:hypothetical protein
MQQPEQQPEPEPEPTPAPVRISDMRALPRSVLDAAAAVEAHERALVDLAARVQQAAAARREAIAVERAAIDSLQSRLAELKGLQTA